MNECGIYLVIDSNGEFAVGKCEDEAREKYEEEFGALNECDGFRIVRINAKVKLPVLASVAVVVDGDEASVTV